MWLGMVLRVADFCLLVGCLVISRWLIACVLRLLCCLLVLCFLLCGNVWLAFNSVVLTSCVAG